MQALFDATFACVPHPFYQLLILQIRLGGVSDVEGVLYFWQCGEVWGMVVLGMWRIFLNDWFFVRSGKVWSWREV